MSFHQVRICMPQAHFAFFSRADSGIHLLADDVDIYGDTLSINVKANNFKRSQAAPLSRFTSPIHKPQRLFQQLQSKRQRLRRLNMTRTYWVFQDEQPAKPRLSWVFLDEQPVTTIITTCIREIMDVLGLHTPPEVSYTGHSLRRGGASATNAINVSTPSIVSWGLCRDFKTIISYIDDNVDPDLVKQ
jgi:hypothetical protein